MCGIVWIYSSILGHPSAHLQLYSVVKCSGSTKETATESRSCVIVTFIFYRSQAGNVLENDNVLFLYSYTISGWAWSRSWRAHQPWRFTKCNGVKTFYAPSPTSMYKSSALFQLLYSAPTGRKVNFHDRPIGDAPSTNTAFLLFSIIYRTNQ